MKVGAASRAQLRARGKGQVKKSESIRCRWWYHTKNKCSRTKREETKDNHSIVSC